MRRPGAGAALFAAGTALLALAFAVSGLGNSSVFGWKQELVCVAGVAIGGAGLALMVRDRRGAVRHDARHELLVSAAQLLGLSALAVAQPLFDLLSDNAEFFVARGSRGVDVVVFTVALALGPPLVLFAAELLAGLAGRGVRRALHLVFVAALVALLVLNALNDVGRVPTGIQLLVAAYAGAAAAAAVWAFEPAAALVTFSAPAALLFAVLFVTSPGISAIFEPEANGRGAETARDVPVVMVVFDEFPPNLMLDAKRRIDARRFPNFARLARTSTWYSHATTVADETSEAVPAIVTGQYPVPGHTLPISSQHPDNLFTLLARTHRLNVQEEITQLCPERLCRGNREDFGGRMRSIASDGWVVWRRLVLPPGLRSGLPDITTGWSGFGGSPAAAAPTAEDTAAATHADRPARYRRFLASIGPGGGRPPLDYVHVLLPHVPWWYLPSGQAYENGEYMPGLTADYRWTGGDGARFSAWQRMLLQARYTDRLLGELLRRLTRTGMLDRSVVVVLADHGAAMRPGDFRRRFTARTVGELAPVPLFIKAPGQHRGRTMTKHVRTLDVVPTIAALVGARLPWHTDGRSLAGGTYPEPTRLKFHRVFGGVDVVASVAELERRRSSALAEQLRLFGTGSPFPGLGGPALRDDLVGKPAAQVRARLGDAAPVVESPEQFEHVDPSGNVVPAFVTGGIPGLGAGVHRQVAVEVNGRVAAVGESFDLNGGQSFAVMVPNAVFRRGRNDVRAVVVG